MECQKFVLGHWYSQCKIRTEVRLSLLVKAKQAALKFIKEEVNILAKLYEMFV